MFIFCFHSLSWEFTIICKQSPNNIRIATRKAKTKTATKIREKRYDVGINLLLL